MNIEKIYDNTTCNKDELRNLRYNILNQIIPYYNVEKAEMFSVDNIKLSINLSAIKKIKFKL